MNETQSSKKRRYGFLIYPKFQLTLVLFNAGIITVSFGAINVQIARSFASLRNLGQEAGLATTHPYYRFLDMQLELLNSNMGYALLGALLFCSFISLILSHRLAGPVQRLKTYFEGIIANGHSAPVSFRKGDFFQELPQAINQALEKMKK